MAGRLGGLTHPVRLAVYTRADGCDTCADTRAIVEEVAALSSHLSVETHDRHAGEVAPGVEHLPAIVVLREVDGALVDHGVRLVGAPVGHELTSLADAILTVGSGDPGLTGDSLARLATLSQPVHVQVFSTPTSTFRTNPWPPSTSPASPRRSGRTSPSTICRSASTKARSTASSGRTARGRRRPSA